MSTSWFRTVTIAAAAACTAGAVGTTGPGASGQSGEAGASSTLVAGPPSRVTLVGVVRDFRADHPDFQRMSKNAAGASSGGLFAGIVANELDKEGKPVFASRGHRVVADWTDGRGNPIMPFAEDKAYYDIRETDSFGVAESEGDAVTSAESFAQWYRDVAGVNHSFTVDIRMNYDDALGAYVFDDRTDPIYAQLGGFFPINGNGYGDYENDTNFHFTFELDTEFVYRAGTGQTFTFSGDDDVWVFIDGKLVIDLGGLHSRLVQTVELDRLNWLEDGEHYDLKFFFAERHTSQSNFRMVTDIELRSAPVPSTAALFD